MNLNYSQSLGTMSTDDGTVVGQGWAGNGPGKNNPALQDSKSVGPLPRGVYSVGKWGTHEHLGSSCASLTQISGETFGRSGFYIHGASRSPDNYGQESRGCIVMPAMWRLKIVQLLPSTITVTL